MMRWGVVPIFIPHKGCPNDCSFCNQHVITGSASAQAADIPELVKGIRHRFDHIEVAFYGGSFTAIPRAERQDYLMVASHLKARGQVQGIRCSTRPDALDDGVVEELVSFGVDRVEIGVQTTDDGVLSACNRGCTTLDAQSATKRLKAAGIKTGIQLMAGLPGATVAIDVQSALDVVTWEPDFVRIYPTVVLGGTALERDSRNGSYQPMTLDDAVKRCAGMASVFYDADIPVIRIGLQEAGDDMVMGPFHPAMRDFVDNEYIITGIIAQSDAVTKTAGQPFAGVTIFHPKEMVSVIVGQKKCGLLRLKNHFGNVKLEIWDKKDIGICIDLTDGSRVWGLPVKAPVKDERQ